MMPDNHTSDDSDARIAQREAQVAEIVARCGNIYTRFRLSPPMALRAAAQHWVGLSLDEVARVVEDHLREHKRLYSGSGDGYFWISRGSNPQGDRSEVFAARPRWRGTGSPAASATKLKCSPGP